ncbi:hypothetical protein [Amycolatopsis sp. NPDC001319]|uniref:hypothetical protein n=1 Tax=unclassified Amycolatopsis TaxID=2618356 RepID=UPI0036AF45D7
MRNTGTRRVGRVVLPFGLVMTAALATACGGGGSPGPVSTISRPPSAPHSATAPVGTTVTATLTDFHIALSTQNLHPGTYTIHAVNAGQTAHSLEIDGPGVSDQTLPSALNTGQSGDLTVTLQPGSYEIYCPVDAHKEAGMDLKLTVS